MEPTRPNSHDAYQKHDTGWKGFLAEDHELRPFYEDVYLGANNDATITSDTDAITNNGYADEMHMDLLCSLDTNTEEHIPGRSDTDAGGVARDLAYLGGYYRTADELAAQDPADTTITQAPLSSGGVLSYRESSVAGLGPQGPNWSLEAPLQPGLPPLPLPIDGFGIQPSSIAPPESVIQYDQRPDPHDIANFNHLLLDRPFQASQPNAQLSHILQDASLDQMPPYQAHLKVPTTTPPSLGFVPADNIDPLSHVQPFHQRQTMEPLQPSGTFPGPDQTLLDNAVYSDLSNEIPQTAVDDARQYEGFGLQPFDPGFSGSQSLNRTTGFTRVSTQSAYSRSSPPPAGNGIGLWRDVGLHANTPNSPLQAFSQPSYANSPLPVQLMTDSQPIVYGPAKPSKPSNSRRSRKDGFPTTTMTRKAGDKSINTRAFSKHDETVSRDFQRRTGAPGCMVGTINLLNCTTPYARPNRTKGKQKDGKKRRTCIVCWRSHTECSGNQDSCDRCIKFRGRLAARSTSFMWTCDVRINLEKTFRKLFDLEAGTVEHDFCLEREFNYISETIPSTLDFLENEYKLRSVLSRLDPWYAWLSHTESLSAWRDVLIFVNPEIGEQLTGTRFLSKCMAWVCVRRLDKSDVVLTPQLAVMTAVVLAWIDDYFRFSKPKDYELLHIVCSSLRTHLQVILTRIEMIAEGRDVPPDTFEDFVICTMTESPAVGTILPPQYQNRKWDQLKIKNMYFTSREEDLQAACMRKDGDPGGDHCDSCLCAFVYHGVPDFLLRLFGFENRDSPEWITFVLNSDWSFAFGTQCSWRPLDLVLYSLCIFGNIFSVMFLSAFNTLRKVLQREELCLSIEELMLDWKLWRPSLLFFVCRATARIFGSEHKDNQVLHEILPECCKELDGLVEKSVVTRKNCAITRVGE